MALSAPPRGGLAKAFLNLTAAPSIPALLFTMLLIGPTMRGHYYVAIGAVLLVAAYRLLPRNDHRVFVIYILGFAIFNGIRNLADNTGFAVNYTYPIDIDAAMFGAVPTSWLQDHLYEPGRLTALDWASALIYSSYFWAQFVVAGLIWAFRRQLLERFVGVTLVTLVIGVAFYAVLPTAPPWLAAETGDLPQTARISWLVLSDVWTNSYSQGTHIVGPNDVAAMPSLHTALSVVIAMAAWRTGRLIGLLGWSYAFAMAFVLVYVGEHYVIDAIAGAAAAVFAWRFVARLEQRSSITVAEPAAAGSSALAAERERPLKEAA
ncbi:MAG TPA: phosphatase PAP2 family protein [Dehalococcoidia bacterium]|nr:phosphatase PAP2 family protein [Dehalococcoidia bacterium]